jgi:hypothetical protein
MVEKFDLFNYSLIPYFGKDSNSTHKHEFVPLNLKIFFFFKLKKKKKKKKNPKYNIQRNQIIVFLQQ